MLAAKGLRALQVRPEQGEDHFSRQLVSVGATLYHCPVMRIQPFVERPESDAFLSEIEHIKSQILEFNRYQVAIFVSRSAAVLGMEWLSRYWAKLPVGVRYYAVGNSTAVLLREKGIRAEVPELLFNSEGLLALPSLKSVAGEQVLIFSGEGGRTFLADQLRARSAIVDQCELYRRESIDDYSRQITELLVDDKVDVVIVHSGELLDHLLTNISGSSRSILMALPLLVPGERVAKLAKNYGFQNVLCADSALPEDMVSALLGWYSGRH